MKLHLQLFVWIGSLFLIGIIITFYLIESESKALIEHAEKELTQDYVQEMQYTLQKHEDHLQIKANSYLGRLNALLFSLQNWVLNDKNVSKLNNKELSSQVLYRILNQAPWIDFAQSYLGDTVHYSNVISHTKALEFRANIIDESLACLNLINPPFKTEEHYLGIKVQLNNHHLVTDSTKYTDIYYLYSISDLHKITQDNFSSDPKYKNSINNIKKILSNSETTSLLTDKVDTKAKFPNTSPYHLLYKAKGELVKELALNFSLINTLLSNEEHNRLQTLNYTVNKGLEHKLLSNEYINGAAFIDFRTLEGYGTLLKKTDQATPLLNKKQIIVGLNPVFTENIGIAPPSTFTDHENSETYIVNTMIIKHAHSPTSYITIGINLESILADFSIARDFTTIATKQGKIIAASNNIGVGFHQIPGINDLPIEEMEKAKFGHVMLKDKSYYYQCFEKKLSPWNTHIFVLSSHAPLQARLLTIKDLTNTIFSQVTWIFTIAGAIFLLVFLIALLLIIKRITKPLSTLSQCTTEVANGKYPDISKLAIKSTSSEIATLSLSFENMVRGLQDREKTRAILDKVVSKAVANKLVEGGIQLGGETKKITVLFADIRNFTSSSENTPPQRVIQNLNTYMTRMSSIIETYQGIIDKYVGDEIMALFGAPLPLENSPSLALQCAVDMIKSQKKWNLEREEIGLAPIEIGIGLHYGDMVLGNMGAENRLNYTAIGANVNLASRLCSLAKPMQIIISNNIANLETIYPYLHATPLAPQNLKGITQCPPLFSVYDFTPPK